jgi:glycine/D-amino acid oxidase-like deaminating enzyme
MNNDSFTIDAIIIGQGICGTFLTWYLWKSGVKVLVIDDAQPYSATKVASGVINPVTGRQVVTTWMAEELMPFAGKAYTAIGNDIGANVISQKNIIVFPPSQQMREAYDKRIGEENSYIKQPASSTIDAFNDIFYSFYGVALIEPVWLVDLHPLLNGWRKILQQQNMLLEETFSHEHLTIHNDAVTYKNITAQKIIFCNGIQSFQLPYWQNLPFVFNKGEALIVAIPGLPTGNIYKVGNSTIVPWYNGLWWVGSSYENSYDDALPTQLFKQKKLQELQMHIKLPVTVVGHLASLRPAVAVERRPFAGFHPFIPAVGILNGMGTKGCSLAPYFAQQLAENLISQKPIDPLADIKRFKRILQPAWYYSR